jgi:hypothetical protein
MQYMVDEDDEMSLFAVSISYCTCGLADHIDSSGPPSVTPFTQLFPAP